jgi:hypothetical protein
LFAGGAAFDGCDLSDDSEILTYRM